MDHGLVIIRRTIHVCVGGYSVFQSADFIYCTIYYFLHKYRNYMYHLTPIPIDCCSVGGQYQQDLKSKSYSFLFKVHPVQYCMIKNIQIFV